MATPHRPSSFTSSVPVERNLPWVAWILLPLAVVILAGIAREWTDFVIGFGEGVRWMAGK